MLVVRCCAAVGPPGAPHTGIQRQRRGQYCKRVDERSGVVLLRCRVRVVDGTIRWQTPPRGYQGGVPEEKGTTEGWDGMIQSDVADRRSGSGRCCPELREKEACPGQVNNNEGH